MVTVVIPTQFRALCGGERRVDVPGDTLADVLMAADSRCPGFFARVVDEGRVRPELAIAINGEILSLPLHERMAEGAEITIVPALGGGGA
jgi:molybdopterin converting factor small subunit